MFLGDRLGHLTYSMLVHPADTWPDLWRSVQTYLPAVKERLSPDAAFGICLRLSAATAATLHADADARGQLRDFLEEHDLYVFTSNAFPYGDFKAGPVKEHVYQPNWSTPERLQYTTNVADVLADLARPGIEPSIQTAPLDIKHPGSTALMDSYAENVLSVVAHLVDLQRKQGTVVSLAIEPEPWCVLETTDETIEFFEEYLYSRQATSTLGRLAGLSLAEAQAAIRRHAGIVFDICHQAVEHEDITEALTKLHAAGIPILKLQEAAAIDVPDVTAEAVDVLEQYTGTIYLTQTLERRPDGRVLPFLNLEDAITDWRANPRPAHWRVHIHVPVFLESLGAFGTTQPAIAEALNLHAEQFISTHLEVETYTWDVLPEELRTTDIVEDVCREVGWVHSRLTVFAEAA
jgi:sugar phosphate isomerase/epimerase